MFTRTIQPPLPKYFPVQVRATVTDNLTLTSNASRTFGILEYLGNQPLYINKLYAMYRYSVVTGVTVEARLTNNASSGAVSFGMAVMPASDVPSTNIDEITEMPGSKHDTVASSNGMNKSILKISANAQSVFGAPYFTRDFWINSAQSISSTPLDAQEPVIVSLVSDQTGVPTGITALIQYFITFNAVFFDLQTAT